MFLKNKIYLASKSPRRNELLRGMGFEFEVMPTNVKEAYPAGLSPAEVAEYLSALKLSTIDFRQFSEGSLFIACDTIVVVGGEILGKPKDAAEAYRMLLKKIADPDIVIREYLDTELVNLQNIPIISGSDRRKRKEEA